LLFFFRFASFVSLFSLFLASFLLILHVKSTVSLQSETTPSISLRSQKNFATVSLSFALKRKRTAHPRSSLLFMAVGRAPVSEAITWYLPSSAHPCRWPCRQHWKLNPSIWCPSS
jgi:hypothetical protein